MKAKWGLLRAPGRSRECRRMQVIIYAEIGRRCGEGMYAMKTSADMRLTQDDQFCLASSSCYDVLKKKGCARARNPDII